MLSLTRPHRPTPCRRRTRRHTILLSAVLLHAAAGVSAAQTLTTASATDGITAPGAQAGSPAGSYALGGLDSINPYSGGLGFRLPLLRVGGRGSAGYTVTLPVERKWRVDHVTNDPNLYCERCDLLEVTHTYSPTDLPWGITPGYGAGVLQGRHAGSLPVVNGQPGQKLYSLTLTRLTFTASDGTEYELRDELTGGRPLSHSEGGGRGSVFVTADGSSATFVADAPVSDIKEVGDHQPFHPSGYLTLRDGTRYRINAGHVESIRDRQGNKVTIGGSGGETVITDALGREVRITYASFPSVPYDEIKFKGAGGVARRIRVHYARLFDRLRLGYSLKSLGDLFPTLDGSHSTPYDPQVVASVELPSEPAGSRRYYFRYNDYGELAKVEMPTGGAFEYDFQTDPGVVDLGTSPHDPTSLVHEYDIYRRALRKRVYNAGAAPEGRTEFGGGCTPGYNSTEATVKQYGAGAAPLAASRHYYDGCAVPWMSLYSQPTHYAGWSDGREHKTEVLDPDTGAVLRRTEQEWRQREAPAWWGASFGPQPANDPRLVETKTAVEPSGANLVAKTSAVSPADPNVVGFDQHNNQTDVWEYDFGFGAPGALVRHTHTDYVTGSAYTDRTGAHLRGLPRAQKVYGVIGGIETLAAQSETLYDQYSPATYPAVSGWDSTVPAARGNATTQRAWVDTTNTWLETHAAYDQLGNVVSATDARGNTSSVAYGDAFSDGIGRNTYAFPTATTSAIPAPSPGPYAGRGSATALTASTVYDYSTGLATSATDANGKVTSFQYNDPLDRLKRVDRPDGGWTTYDYGNWANAGVLSDNVRTLTAVNGSQSAESYQFFDGLGRPNRSFVNDGGAGGVYITSDTQYDALGRAWRVSNPYRTGGSNDAVNPSGVWTTTAYDALGRVVAVTTPDAAVVSTAYGGNTVTVTDQAGKKRRSVTDALGRLRQVVEAPEVTACQTTGAGCVTNYAYDALGNLRKVEQGVQSRFFMYDSLSRLIRARNPEQTTNASLTTGADRVSGNTLWSMAYDYDANSNLWHRTDARNITSTYAYDHLNRPVATNYSDATPDVLLTYDFAANGRGHSYSDHSDGTQGTTNYVTAYDAVGRPAARRTDFYMDGAGWVGGYTTTRAYDLAGNVKSQTYPSGRAVNNTQFDAAGRLKNMSGNLGDGVTRTYAGDISYDAAGRMREERFGTATPLYHKLHYNARGQLYDVRLSTVGWATNDWDWDRGALALYYGGAPHGQSGANNNGNITRAEHWVPTDANSPYGTGGQGPWAIYATDYQYDALNRLDSATETALGSGAAAATNYTQAYKYDRFGNREIDAARASANPARVPAGAINARQFSVDAATNRLGVPSGQGGVMNYDYAGNLTVDTYSASAAQRTYDAEGRMTLEQNSQSSIFYKYTYDASGKRVRRDLGGQQTWQVYGFDGELVAEYAAGSSPAVPQKEYGYRSGEMLVVAATSAEANLALGKTATQSSTLMDAGSGIVGSAPRAVDGNTAGAWSGGSVTHTLNDAEAWWQVDLGGVQSLSAVKVWNRTDCCAGRLSNFYVLVSDAPFASTDLNAAMGQAGVSSYLTSAQAGSPTSVAVNRTGRYVRVQLAGTNYLSLAEVQVLPAAGNLAAGKPAAQSSTPSWGGPASQAVDGNTSGVWSAGSVAHTDADAQAWWQVDLGAVGQLQQVKVWNRTDCCSDRLSNFYVFVSDAPFQSTSLSATQGQAGVSGYYTAAQGGTPTTVTVNRTGRYVRVQLAGTNYLSLGEVQVIGQAGSSTDVRWLVSDHLGTPRMTVDATGGLAGIKRHDYLPFGEEVGAGVGGRTTNQGYGQLDGNRKKWAQLERDDETGLDYAQARYYSPAMGRFTSPDEFTGGPDELFDFVDDAADNPTFYADLTNPQSLNKYQYGYNNPLRYNDPNGHCPDCPAQVLRWLIPLIPAIPAAPPIAVVGAIVVIAASIPGDSTQGDGSCHSCDNYINNTRTRLDKEEAAKQNLLNKNTSGDQSNSSGNSSNPSGQANGTNSGTPSGGREGKNFTPKGKKTVIDRNKEKNSGRTRCESCGVETVPARKSQRGVRPPRNETQVDHKKAKSKGGSGTPDNGQVLCRGCNRDKSDNEE